MGKDGNTVYRYVGHVLPEVVKYFENEGYDVKCFSSIEIIAMTKGYPLYLFTISDLVTLSDEELKQAEEYNYEDDNDEVDSSGFPEIFKSLF